MIPYLLDYPLKNKFDIIDLLVQNMNRKSIAKIVIKLLLFDEKEVNINLNQKKMELLLKILEELKNTNDPDKYECICSTMEYVFCDENFLIEFIKSQKILELCFTILEESKENSKKFIDVMKLITKINESIIKIINHEDIPIYIQENFIDTISCHNFFDENEKRDIKNNSIEEQNIKCIIINLLYLLEKNKLYFFDDLDSYH